MGVRGLTTFIAHRSSQYLERHELHDTHLVLDGNSIASQLYKWHCKCNDCYGGDYDKYANVVYTFFKLLLDCNITPLVIFDGAYEKRKLKTVYSRLKNKISASKNLNSVTEGRISLFPLFLRELFVDIALKWKIQCVRCDFEGDSDVAYLARTLQCPVLSYDSDFYIFDVLYIPFSTMELKLRKKKDANYIVCEIYRVDKFLNSFGGLDKVHLPLFAVLLGNDYIKKRNFSRFYRQLKMHKTKHNEQQTQIKSVIMWLRNETPESALRKILGRYKLKFRRQLARKIGRALKGYQHGVTPVCSYFNIEERSEQNTAISVPNPEEIELVEDENSEGDEECDESEEKDEEEEDGEEKITSEESSEEDEEVNAESTCFLKYSIPNFFRENFRRCLYPSSFMDIITGDRYYCLQQMEDFSCEHSNSISLDILGAISKILSFPKTRKLMVIARNENSHLKRYFLPLYEKDVPKLMDIEYMDEEARKTAMLDILNIQESTFSMFPNSWHLFLISIKYWVRNSKNKIDPSYIYSLILCSVVLSYVDSKIGFYRSTKSFFTKYGTNNQTSSTNPSISKNINGALDDIDSNNSVACMTKLIHYFQMYEKSKSYVKWFDRSIIHEFAQFQSCLLHIKYLNSLFNFPFPNILVSNFYDGTFLYNMTTNLQKRTDLKSYIKLLLEECPKILNAVELIMAEIEEQVVEDVGRHEPQKKRRKKKKTAENLVPEAVEPDIDDDEEDYEFDANNKFSLLSFMNK